MPDRAAECRHKHALVRQYMEARHLDAVVLTRRANFSWLSAGGMNHVGTFAEVGNASLVVRPQSILCVTSTIESPRLPTEELAGLPIETRPVAWHDAVDAERVWKAVLGNARFACDAAIGAMPKGALTLDPDFDQLRWTLTPDETARYRLLAREVADSLETACRETRPGATEHGLAGRIAGQLHARGIRTPVILVAADDRVRRYRHPLPTAAKFERYGMGVCTGERHGLMVSVTRLFSFGILDEDLRRRHEAVCRVDAAMINATRPGRTLGEIFSIAQRAYAETGFPDEWQHHHQGGSTGYNGREVRATPTTRTTAREHQVFAWNPSIAGTKSEDTILVGPGGNEVLSTTGQWPAKAYDGVARSDILTL